jgi:hypothetical protein
MLRTIREEKVQELLKEVFTNSDSSNYVKLFGSLQYAIGSTQTTPPTTLSSCAFNKLVKQTIQDEEESSVVYSISQPATNYSELTVPQAANGAKGMFYIMPIQPVMTSAIQNQNLPKVEIEELSLPKQDLLGSVSARQPHFYYTIRESKK